jgi:hypothetical protein
MEGFTEEMKKGTTSSELSSEEINKIKSTRKENLVVDRVSADRSVNYEASEAS